MLRMKKISTHDDVFALAWKVMTDAFPVDERRSLEAHTDIEKDPRFAFFAILSGDKCAGAVGMWNFTRFTFVEHLAIAKGERSMGMGSEIVHEILDSSPVPVVIEVEPTSAGAEALRRIVFYRTLGFIVNEYEYVQPAYGAGKNPVPMLLLTYPAPMTTAMLDDIRDTLYREVYHL